LLTLVSTTAGEAHRELRGRPSEKPDLAAAYRCLARWYQVIHGTDKFTNTWHQTEDGLSPNSPAMQFLYDVMKMIDPVRPRLAQELRDLGKITIPELAGPRQGRGKSKETA